MKHHPPQFLKLVEEAKTRVQEITLLELVDLQKKHAPHVLIDVREDHEWSKGHIPGATHLGKGIIERDIEVTVPNPQEPIILYCGGGFRSVLAADALQKMGYTKVFSLAGGWREWQETQT